MANEVYPVNAVLDPGVKHQDDKKGIDPETSSG
jgi:hypothetical protein